MSDHLRVTVICHELHPYGGQERVTYELVRRLLLRGAKVTVVALKCDLPQSDQLRWIRIRGPRRPFLLTFSWFFLVGTIAAAIYGRGFRHSHGALTFNKVDAVTVHLCHQGYSKLPAADRRGRVSVLHTFNSYLCALVQRYAERGYFRPSRVRTLVGVSTGVADELRQSFPRMASRVTVIPNGVDHEEFRPNPDARARTRSAAGIGDDDLLAVFVGGAWERKGVPIALAGVAETRGWHLMVAGTGDAEWLRELASRHDASARLHLYGQTKRPSEVWAAGDALVFPTVYEGFSLATLEAAATGLPLLIGRVPGSAELIAEGETGFFIDRTSDSVHRALEALADDPPLRRRMGEAARRVSEKYSWDNCARGYVSLYTSAASLSAAGSVDAPVQPRKRES